MKHNNKKQTGCLSARAAALMATFCLCTSAWAENKVVIDNINILPGGEAVVNVDLQNEDNIMSSIQMDVVIPDGVDVKEGSIKFVGNRVDEEDFFLYMQKQEGAKMYRILVLPQDLNSSFAGNQGNLLQFTVTANSNLKPKQQIEVKSIVGSDANADKWPMKDFTVDVQQMVGSFAISAATEGDLLLKPSVEGNSQRISFSLSNTISVRALEAVITLPEGAQVVMNEKGSVKIDRGSRVPTNLKFSSSVIDNKVKVVLSGLTADVLQGTEGEVFAFYVSGTEALAENSEVTVSNVILSDNAASSFDVYESHSLNLINMDKVYLAPAQEVLSNINTALEEALTTISEECADVKDSTSVQEAVDSVNTMITELTNAITAAYEDETLASDYDNIVAPQEEIMAAIAALVETAKQAQADYETEQALNAAYAQATEMVDSLTQILTDSVAVIAQTCPDVKESEEVLTAKATIETQIAALSEAIEAAKADGSLTAELENILAPKDEIAAAIAALVETAQKAQADYETEQALNAAYAYAQAELEKLNSAYNEAVETINNECADVKESEAVQTAKTAIEGQIAALREAVEAAKADGTLIEKQEELMTKKAEAEAAIAALIETAKKAQADYETEQALNAAYAYAQAELEKLDSAYNEAVETINNECADVKESETVLNAEASAKALIAALREAVETGKADGTLIEKQEELLTKKAEAEAAITAMVETAKKAQADYETEQALNAAYAYAQAELEKLDSAYNEAVETINNECADVKESETVMDAEAAAKALIDALGEDVEAAKADGTLIEKQEELMTKKAEAEAAIAALVETAQKAQAEYETEQALNAAYAYAQAELEKLNSAYNEAVETINNECADVKESKTVMDAEAAAKALIDALREAVEAAKADGTLIEKQEELMTKKAEAEAAITAMVETAKKAQADYETEQALNAAYAQAIEVVNGLNQKLASAVTAIETFCPDAKDADVVTEAKAAIEAQIAALSEAIEAAKADGSLTANIETVLAPKSDIENAITALMEIAKKAQADYEAEQALNAAYAQATEVVKGLNEKLASAMEAIETFCPDVKDSTLVTDAQAAIEEQITALSDAIEAAKADGSLTANLATILAPKADIEDAITKLLEDARQAQKDIDTGIEEIAAQQGASKIYTLSGKQVSRMEKGGVYLIKYANGSTKKILVK